MRALVVDDSAPVRRRLLALLGEHPDCEILEASTSAQALSIVDSQELDAVVLDLRLGGTSGLELIAIVRERLPRALLVVLTNEPTPAHRRECMMRGADFFFDKSHQFERAAEVIAQRPPTR